MKKSFVLAALVLIFFDAKTQLSHISTGGGTTILTFITPDSIIMAADSRHSRHFFDGRITADTVCKIEHFGDIFYCFSGTSDIFYKNNKVFNVYDILKSCFRKRVSFKHILVRFNSKLNHQVRKMVKYVGPRYFFDSLPGRSLLEIILVRFHRDLPEYNSGIYMATGNNKRNLYIQFFEDLYDSSYNLNKAGYHEHIDSFLSHNPGYLESRGTTEQRLISLIKMEAEHHPQKVACPIDMILIKNKPHTWTKKTFYCE
jgi:hypothetical protein